MKEVKVEAKVEELMANVRKYVIVEYWNRGIMECWNNGSR